MSELVFQAAVECAFSAVFNRDDGTWEGHDFKVEVVVERAGLDQFDVVMDFRCLEKVLMELLAPMRGRLLSELGISNPLHLAEQLMNDLAPKVPEPARLHSLSLTDGSGRRLSLVAKP